MDAIERIMRERPVERLWEQTGTMVRLGSEDDVLKLDWVQCVPRLLAHDSWLEDVEQEAANIVGKGIRHIIWSGMGGSIMAVRVLVDLGFFASGGSPTIHPLDSTDPAAINAILRRLGVAHDVDLAREDPSVLQQVLGDVMMVTVSMGMTSEEPITHLQWFTGLLDRAGLSAAEHILVMTLPDSYLDRFAREHDVPRRSLQLDGGTGTGGRMSAPGTRVFLLPAALALGAGDLRAVMDRAWHWYNFEGARRDPADHPFVRLAAALSDSSVDGACGMMVEMPLAWRAIVPWVEQLMEESLGKGGKGIVVFDDRNPQVGAPRAKSGMMRVAVGGTDDHPEGDSAPFRLALPYMHADTIQERLAATSAMFLGWQLAMALYGYLENITFAGQPAVEAYKARARQLRDAADPVQVLLHANKPMYDGPLILLTPPDARIAPNSAAASLASLLVRTLPGTRWPAYLDLTFNGETSPEVDAVLDTHLRRIGTELLGVPVKLRRAPAAYHSTEQSEMDGPGTMVSIRVVAGQHEPVLLGAYTDTFLKAQAVGTWQAMVEQGRPCFLVVMKGRLDQMIEPLDTFFQKLEDHLEKGRGA